MISHINDNFFVNIYSDSPENNSDLKNNSDLNHMQFNANLMIDQVFSLKDDENLSNILFDIQNSVVQLSTHKNLDSINFNVSQVWNNPQEYNVYFGIYTHGELNEITSEIKSVMSVFGEVQSHSSLLDFLGS